MTVPIHEQFEDIKSDYPDLVLIEAHNGSYVRGRLSFTAKYQDKGSISDSYVIEIFIPSSGTPPTAKEIGGRIPKDFHKNPKDGTLCLAARVEVKRKFSAKPNLRGFIETLLVPYLYTYSYKEKHQDLPYGDLPHGEEGVLQYYKSFFNTDSDLVVLELLKLIVENNYRGESFCPCKSGKKLMKCHGEKIKDLKSHQGRREFLFEFMEVLKACENLGQEIPDQLFTKKLKRYATKKLK